MLGCRSGDVVENVGCVDGHSFGTQMTSSGAKHWSEVVMTA